MTTTHPPHRPQHYPRRILLAVTGLSPQIVTETVYALTQTCEPSFCPTEIHIITTDEGRERIRLDLLSEQPGWFHRLRTEYALPDIAFHEHNIHVLQDFDGQALNDIRSLENNEQAADGITEYVRKLTADPESALYVSIAGGRKTMGFYLGYALSLYGRMQDRLSHVLVSGAYESHPEFYYPNRQMRVIHTRDHRPLDTSKAEVTLAEIPFVRLREGLPDLLLQGRSSFSQTVQAAQQHISPHLRIECTPRQVYCGGQRIPLKPAEFVFFLWMVQRRLDQKPAVRWSDDSETLTQELLDLTELYGSAERAEQAWSSGISKEYFDERRSRVKSALQRTLGKHGAKPYLIQGEGKRPQTRYALQIQPEAIEVIR